MSIRMRAFLVALSMALGILSTVATLEPARAVLECDELAYCSGGGICSTGGDPIGCIMHCSSGGTVECEEKP